MNKKPPYFRPLTLPSPPAKPAAQRVEFDVTDSGTWGELPPADSIGGVIVTFPMSEPEAFWEAYLGQVADRGRPILCYSTTSVYQVDTPGQNVDERTPLRSTPRATAEEYIQERGATLLTISGIFGDRRTPRAICTCLSTYTSAGGAVRIALARAEKRTANDPPADPATPVCVRAAQRAKAREHGPCRRHRQGHCGLPRDAAARAAYQRGRPPLCAVGADPAL